MEHQPCNPPRPSIQHLHHPNLRLCSPFVEESDAFCYDVLRSKIRVGAADYQRYNQLESLGYIVGR